MTKFGIVSIIRLSVIWLLLSVSLQAWSADDPNRIYIQFTYGEPETKEVFVDFLKDGQVVISTLVNKKWVSIHKGPVTTINIPKDGISRQQGEPPKTTKVIYVDKRKDYFEFGAPNKFELFWNNLTAEFTLNDGEKVTYWASKS